MMKKILSVTILSVLIAYVFFTNAFAIDNIKIEQVASYIPEMTIAFKAETLLDEKIQKEDCFATLGNESLEIENVEKYDSSKHSSTVYFLVDISDSVPKSCFDAAKKKLVEYSNKLPKNDRMILLAFGTKVNILLNGNESVSKRKEVINSLSRTDSETNLYNAIAKAVELSQSDTSKKFDRSFAIVLSDGENFETSGGNTEQEVKNSVSGHGLPIYAFCMGGTRDNASKFGSFSRLSGGEIVTVNKGSSVNGAFDTLVKKTENIYLISAKSYLQSDGSEKNLKIRIKDKSDGLDVKFVRWIKDETAPTIVSAEMRENDEGIECLYIYYSENVCNADNSKNFVIRRSGTDNEISFLEAEYRIEDGEYYSVLVPSKTVSKHNDYIIETKNITDSANEKNSLVSCNEEFFLGSKSDLVIIFIEYWWILIAIVILTAAIFAFLKIVKKKKTCVTESFAQEAICEPPIVAPSIENYRYDVNIPLEKHHVVTPEGKRIVLKVSDGKTVVRTVETMIYSRLVIGRSDQCDVYFDDLKMSRRHFEIERIGNEFWINDLESANGTILNNIKINRKRKLFPNDVIIAGQQTIVVLF